MGGRQFGPGTEALELSRLIQEFLPLNRRRLEGEPPLSESELSRWQELQAQLERGLGVTPPRGAAARRRTLRVPVRLPVRYTDGLARATSVATNLSEGGLFVASQRPLRLRTPLQLAISPRTRAQPVEAGGSVVWTREPGGEQPPGMGIRFENLEPAQERAIAVLVENALAQI